MGAELIIPRRMVASWAAELLHKLIPACLDGIVAGSIRRQMDGVSDVDIVLVPVREHVPTQPSLFGDPVPEGRLLTATPALDAILAELVESGELRPGGPDGAREKRFLRASDGLPVELWLAYPDNYGYIVTLRTGPDKFSKAMVTHWKARVWPGGLMRDGLLHEGGFLWRVPPVGRNELLPCRTEEEYFRLLGVPYVVPKARTIYSVDWLRDEMRLLRPLEVA